MKKIVGILLLAAFTVPVLAEDETLLSGDIESGGYGGPVVKFGKINGSDGIFVGGQGGWIINHCFIIGGGGYGLANDIKVGQNNFGKDEYLEFGYGGLILEYVLSSRKLIHFSVHNLIGAGGVGYVDKRFNDDEDIDGDAFFVMEPGANLMLNIHNNVRFGIGATYRYVNGVDYKALTDSDLSDFTVQILFKFGSF